MTLLNISEAEYETLSRERPDLARQLVQAVLGMRGDPSPGDPPTPEAWADPWGELFTLDEAFLERPPTTYLVEGLLPLPSVTMIYGSPGCLKSMLLMDLAVCVASGQYWLDPAAPGDPPGRRVEQAPVLWVDLDQGEDVMAERLRALVRGHLAPRDRSRLFWKSLPGWSFDLTDQNHLGDMLMRIRSTGARLVCIDNLGLAKGRVDENSDAMIPVLSALRYLADSCRAALVVLHHARKGSGFNDEAADRPRGSTSIPAGVDLGLSMLRRKQSPQVSLSGGKLRRHPVPPFSALFRFEKAEGSLDLGWARFYSQAQALESNPLIEPPAADQAAYRPGYKPGYRPGYSPATRQVNRQGVDAAILECLGGQALNQTELVGAVRGRLDGVGRHSVRLGIERLVRQGRLKVAYGARNRLLYSLVEVPDPEAQ